MFTRLTILALGDRIMVDTSELDCHSTGIVRRSIVQMNGQGVPSIKLWGHQRLIPPGAIRRVIKRDRCIETPFGLDYYLSDQATDDSK